MVNIGRSQRLSRVHPRDKARKAPTGPGFDSRYPRCFFAHSLDVNLFYVFFKKISFESTRWELHFGPYLVLFGQFLSEYQLFEDDLCIWR